MDYKQKYLKYKEKYITLKNQKGGSKEEIESKIKKLEPRCAKTSFSQHVGECWNDALQTLICYSDEIKETVQNKLLNLTPTEIIDLAYFNKREKYLPPIYRRSSTDDEQSKIATKFEKRLVKYLTLLQQRLCMHIDGEKPICKLEEGSSCPITDFNKFLVEDETDTREKTFKRRSSIVSGIGTAYMGNKMTFKNPTVEAHAGDSSITPMVMLILSFCLLDNNEMVIPINIKYEELNKYDIDDFFAILTNTSNHATGFYICNSEELFYNDNKMTKTPELKYKVNWKDLLKKCIEEKIIIFINVGTYIYLKYGNGVITKIMEDGVEVPVNDLKEKKLSLGDELHNLFLLKKEEINDDEIDDKLQYYFTLGDLTYGTLKNITDVNVEFNGMSLLLFSLRYPKLFDELLKKDELELPETNIIYNIVNKLYAMDPEVKKIPGYVDKEEMDIIELLKIVEKSKYKYLFFEKIYRELSLIEFILYYSYSTKIIEYLLNANLINCDERMSDGKLLFEYFVNKIPDDYELRTDVELRKKIINYALKNYHVVVTRDNFLNIFNRYLEDNYIKYLEIIVEKMENVNVRTSTNYDIINFFIDINISSFIPILIKKGADINAKTNERSVLYNLLDEKMPIEFIKMLLNNNVVIDSESFFYILNNYDVEKNKEFIYSIFCTCKNFNIQDNYNKPFLMEIVERKYPFDLIKYAIEQGADVNSQYDDASVLYMAVENDNLDLIKLLIEKGADVNFKYEDIMSKLVDEEEEYKPLSLLDVAKSSEVVDLLKKYLPE